MSSDLSGSSDPLIPTPTPTEPRLSARPSVKTSACAMADTASDDLAERLAAAEAERDKIREKLHNAVRIRTLLPHNIVIRLATGALQAGCMTQIVVRHPLT